jgi:hypothetical protein
MLAVAVVILPVADQVGVATEACLHQLRHQHLEKQIPVAVVVVLPFLLLLAQQVALGLLFYVIDQLTP